jgi:hypothetical protein
VCVIGSVGECGRVENVLFTVAKFVMCVLGLARRAYSVRCEGGGGVGPPVSVTCGIVLGRCPHGIHRRSSKCTSVIHRAVRFLLVPLGGVFPRNPKKRGSTLSLVVPLFSCSKNKRKVDQPTRGGSGRYGENGRRTLDP